MVAGKNPFELLRRDRKDMGHIREYTKAELEVALRAAGISDIHFHRLGLYRFRGMKDRFYSSLADFIHPSLSRSLVAICSRTRESAPAPDGRD
jgi:LmbE family N-acetylglucosaminyl deacetylase